MSGLIRLVCLIWLGAITLSLCGSTSRQKQKFYFEGTAQGTTYHITYFSEKKRIDQHDIEQIFASVDSSLSLYQSYSRINQFNASDRGIEMDKHLRRVILKSLTLHQKFPSYFDITLLPVTTLWGFGPTKTNSTSPDSSAVGNVMKCIGSHHLHLKNNFLQKDFPCVQLDANGIAQGYTVDVIAEFIESKKVHHYMVELGGEIRVRGEKFPEQSPMRIGIESPAKHNAAAIVIEKVIELKSGTVTTSGIYRRNKKQGEKTVSHLMNPSTGFPLMNEMISVTVVAPDAITADGMDNVLMSSGWREGLKILKNYPDVEAYFIFKKNDGTLTDTATAGFYKLLKPL